METATVTTKTTKLKARPILDCTRYPVLDTRLRWVDQRGEVVEFKPDPVHIEDTAEITVRTKG